MIDNAFHEQLQVDPLPGLLNCSKDRSFMKLFHRYICGTAFFLLLFAILYSRIPERLRAPGLRASVQAAETTGGFDGPAELPRVLIDSALRSTPAPGKTIAVHAGEDASKAVTRASCGDTIELQSGATFGSLRLPQKNCDDSHWIVIRTSAPDSRLPAEGTRLTPATRECHLFQVGLICTAPRPRTFLPGLSSTQKALGPSFSNREQTITA